MNLLIGIVVVFGCVLGGFVVHGGKVMALWQPSELVIIGGAALGAFIIANGLGTALKVAGGIAGTLKGSKYGKKHYMALFALMYDLFNIARKDGVIGLEREIDEPASTRKSDGHRTANSPSRIRRTGRRSQQSIRRITGLRYRRGGARHREHHGGARRSGRGDRSKGRRCVGRYVLGNFVGVRLYRSDRDVDGKAR
jgi:hypothetical protein